VTQYLAKRAIISQKRPNTSPKKTYFTLSRLLRMCSNVRAYCSLVENTFYREHILSQMFARPGLDTHTHTHTHKHTHTHTQIQRERERARERESERERERERERPLTLSRGASSL
jgi:hypothetical protein